jgi:hypothetical protein
MRIGTCIAAALALALLAPAADVSAAGTDLGDAYKATLDRDEKNVVAYDTTCEADDVWELTSFDLEVGKRLHVELGPSTVVFGRYGTNVLWSVIVPKEPGRLTSKINSDERDEKVTNLWFRFHPALVGDLFPAKTVRGRGAPSAVSWARRVFWSRINDWCQIESAPCIPTRNFMQLTADVPSGEARFFIADLKNKNVTTFVSTFTKGAVPPVPRTPISKEDALKAFDGAWDAFNGMYAKFGLRPDVDWDKLKAQFRPGAEKAATNWDAAVAIASLVTPLRDLHVHVWAGEEEVPSYFRSRTYNGNWQATQALLGGKVNDTKQDLLWARTKDGIGYVDVLKLEDRRVVAAFDQALEELATTWGLVVDLRGNGGGGEDLALEMAGRIADRERVYAVDSFRREGVTDRLALGPKLERRVAARGPWHYGAPVVVLIGQKTMSSAESFAEMLAVCPDVTSVGDRTCGSSGRPQRVDLPGGIAVNVPTWNDMTPDGTPIEDAGVQPEVPVKAAPDAFDSKDPVMEAALALLRKIPSGSRHAGRQKP